MFDGVNLSRRNWKSFCQITKDWRVGKIVNMDNHLLDILFKLTNKLGDQDGFILLSGYRSPETNASLPGTARKSFHLKGKALDLQKPGVSTKTLFNAAQAVNNGGVGYYPEQHNLFVHVDTGPKRTWI